MGRYCFAKKGFIARGIAAYGKIRMRMIKCTLDQCLSEWLPEDPGKKKRKKTKHPLHGISNLSVGGIANYKTQATEGKISNYILIHLADLYKQHQGTLVFPIVPKWIRIPPPFTQQVF